MVTRTNVSFLLELADGFRYIYERARIIAVENPKQGITVKGPGFILDVLQREYAFIEILSDTFEEFQDVRKSVKWWIIKLKKEYRDLDDTNSKLPLNLLHEDAVSLNEEVLMWMRTLFAVYRKPTTALIGEDKLGTLIPKELMEKLDPIAKDDLKEGMSVLAHGFSTSAAMIFFRAAESVIQNLYKNTIGTESGKRTWGEMLKEIEATEKIRKSLLGYLYYLNEKRIDTAHPYRRYNQEESERILLHLKSLLEEL